MFLVLMSDGDCVFFQGQRTGVLNADFVTTRPLKVIDPLLILCFDFLLCFDC